MVIASSIMAYAVEAKSALHSKWRQLLYMALLIAIWYLFSYAFNASLKDWFRARGDEDEDEHTMLPVLLTVFFSNTVAASVWVLQLTGCLSSPMHAVRGLTYISQAVLRSLCMDLCLMCAAGSIGIAAACVVLQHGSIQLVQVSRSMGPIFTAVWAYLILDQSTRGRALLALALALAGTALASWQEPTFSPLTFCLMLTVNTALTFRNAVTKRILRLALPPPQLPLPLHTSKPPHSTPGGAAASEDTARTLFQLPEVMSCVLLAATNAVGLAGVLLLWGGWTACSSLSGAEALQSLALAMHMPDTTWMLLSWMGVCSFMYNMASQIVLAHVAVVSHGMLELFKRVFVLLAASVLLGDVRWQWHNALGAAIATAGTLLYFCSREAAAAGRPSPGPSPGSGKNGVMDKDSPGQQHPLLDHSVTLKDRLHGSADSLCSAHGGLTESMRKKVQGPWERRGGSSSPNQRLHLAYVAMVLVLLLSPVQFLESLGVSYLTPTWLRRPVDSLGPEGGEWTDPAAGETAAQAPSQQLGIMVAGNSTAGGGQAAGGGQGGGGGFEFSPGNFLVASTAHVRFSMDVGLPPPAKEQQLGGGEVLRGGPHHHGLLPFHTRLHRAAATADAPTPRRPDACVLGSGVQAGGTPAAQPGASAASDQRGSSLSALRKLHRALNSLTEDAGVQASAAASSGQGQAIHTGIRLSKGGADASVAGILPQGIADESAGLIGVYTGWLDQDNLGDEIVADIFLDLLTAAVIEATGEGTVVTLDRASPVLATSGWRGCTLANNSACDFGVMGGGSTIYVDYIRRISGVLAAGRQVLLFGSGFQSGLVPKGSNDKYLRMLCKGRLAGGVRGMYTKGHLEKSGCKHGSVRIIRDSALLAQVLYSEGATVLRPQLQEHSGRRHVVVATLKNESAAVYASAVRTLLRTGKFAVVLQGVDADSTQLHRTFAASVNAQRPPGSPPVLVHDEVTAAVCHPGLNLGGREGHSSTRTGPRSWTCTAAPAPASTAGCTAGCSPPRRCGPRCTWPATSSTKTSWRPSACAQNSSTQPGGGTCRLGRYSSESTSRRCWQTPSARRAPYSARSRSWSRTQWCSTKRRWSRSCPRWRSRTPPATAPRCAASTSTSRAARRRTRRCWSECSACSGGTASAAADALAAPRTQMYYSLQQAPVTVQFSAIPGPQLQRTPSQM